jgi:3-dehydroquinate synthase class II
MLPAQGTGPSSGGLTEVLELILDRGVVIDAYVRISLVGIEVLTIDARVVVASVDTYLRFAEAVNRVNLDSHKAGVPELLEGAKTKDMLEAAAEKYGPALSGILGQASPELQPTPEKRES